MNEPPPHDPSRRERPILHDRPAPVLTEEGAFGTLPPDPLALDDHAETSGLRAVALWAGALLLAIAATLWAGAFTAAQVTAPAVALPALERLVASLTEIDALLEVHREEIAAAGASRSGDPTARVEVPGFPVQGATLTAAEAREGSIDSQRRILLRRSAVLLYQQGPGVLRDPEGGPQSVRVLSTAGGFERMVRTLSERNYDAAQIVLWPLAAAALALAFLVLLLGRGFARFVALGLALLTAGMFLFVGSLGARVVVAVLLGAETPLSREVAAVASTLTGAAARNAMWLAAAGLAIAVPAILLGALFRASIRRHEREAEAAAAAEWR